MKGLILFYFKVYYKPIVIKTQDMWQDRHVDEWNQREHLEIKPKHKMINSFSVKVTG